MRFGRLTWPQTRGGWCRAVLTPSAERLLGEPAVRWISRAGRDRRAHGGPPDEPRPPQLRRRAHRRRRARQPVDAARCARRVRLHRAGGHQRRAGPAARRAGDARRDPARRDDAGARRLRGGETAEGRDGHRRHPDHFHDRPDRDRACAQGLPVRRRGLRGQADQADGGARAHRRARAGRARAAPGAQCARCLRPRHAVGARRRRAHPLADAAGAPAAHRPRGR
jgi:hypothetical protein